MKYLDIREQPTVIEKIHESCYRSYHVLSKVKQMLKRGDSKETIMEMIDFLEHND